MKSNRTAVAPRAPRRGRNRSVVATVGLLLLAMLVIAPSAFAWNGKLVVRKVNIGGPADDSFAFQLTKSPNAYFNVWDPAVKAFWLQGAASAQGPFTEGVTQESYSGLWAGYDQPYNDWVVYSVKETAKPGYTTTVDCKIDGDWNAQLGTTIPAKYGTWTFTPGTDGADTTVATTLRWWDQTPYTTTCTFTNTYRARVKIEKQFDDAYATNPRVDMTVNAADVDAVAPAASETFGDDASSDWVPVTPGSDVALAETPVAGTNLADYTSKLECREGKGEDFGDWYAVSQSASGTLTGVKPGMDYVCRFTNVRKEGKVTIKKIAVDANGAPISGTYSFTGDLGPQDVSANGAGVTLNVAANKTYAITESVPAGYTLTSVVCQDTVNGEGQASSANGATASANVQPGENVICTFTNKQNATPPGSQSVGAGGAVSPVGASGGALKRKGSAKLRGTVGCASSAYAKARVTGKQIRRVTYYVNGKKVKTLTKPNAGTAYELRYRTSSLKVGSYRVRAKVQFTSASGTPAKTLSLQFSRCKVRAVSPQFTG